MLSGESSGPPQCTCDQRIPRCGYVPSPQMRSGTRLEPGAAPFPQLIRLRGEIPPWFVLAALVISLIAFPIVAHYVGVQGFAIAFIAYSSIVLLIRMVGGSRDDDPRDPTSTG